MQRTEEPALTVMSIFPPDRCRLLMEALSVPPNRPMTSVSDARVYSPVMVMPVME